MFLLLRAWNKKTTHGMKTHLLYGKKKIRQIIFIASFFFFFSPFSWISCRVMKITLLDQVEGGLPWLWEKADKEGGKFTDQCMEIKLAASLHEIKREFLLKPTATAAVTVVSVTWSHSDWGGMQFCSIASVRKQVYNFELSNSLSLLLFTRRFDRRILRPWSCRICTPVRKQILILIGWLMLTACQPV